MAKIQKEFNSMGLPMNINRSEPIPIDSTEIYYSLSEAQEYAKNGATAYVGQTIKVVDEAMSTVKQYIIQDIEGTLAEATGSGAIEWGSL